MQHLFLTISFLGLAVVTFAQSSVDGVLTSIARNNKQLAAGTQLLEAQRLQYKTGLTPANPTAEYDYLFGNPANMGNQTDVMVTQSFDFPTVYRKKGQLADVQTEGLDYDALIQRQNLLLEARLTCLEVIGLNKRIAQLKTRVRNARRVNTDLLAKLENEQVSAIEANKARLALLHSSGSLKQLQSERQTLLLRLAEMNGGMPIALPDTVYPALPVLPDVDSLEQQIEAIDPVLKRHQQQVAVSEMQVGLSKALALPKLETGYHYQAILGQTFNGVHLGISIPLWEHRNTVQQRQAVVLYSEMQLEQHRTGHLYEIRGLYAQYESLLAGLAEYEAVLNGLSSETLLQKSLELEQISFIDYALEMEYYYSAIDHYLQLEKELHQTTTKLLKHTL